MAANPTPGHTWFISSFSLQGLIINDWYKIHHPKSTPEFKKKSGLIDACHILKLHASLWGDHDLRTALIAKSCRKKKQFICARLRCAKNSNCWSWENVDHSKVQFFLRSKSQGLFQPPKRSPSPQVKLFVSPFFGLLQICFSRADVQGFMTSAEKMEMPLANKYGKAGHGLHLNTAGHVLWQTDGCWWIWVVRCLGWLVVRWLGADCWENA